MMERKNNSRFLFLAVITIVTFPFLCNISFADEIFTDEFADNDTKARFVIEAEKYSNRSSTAKGSWWEVDGKDNKFIEGPRANEIASSSAGRVRNNYMMALGTAIGDIEPIDSSYDGPFLDYKISIKKSGNYALYLRWIGQNENTDSVYAFILKPDNFLLISSGLSYFLFHGRSLTYNGMVVYKDWIWDNIGLKNNIRCAYAGRADYAIWDIPEPGIYTIRLALREPETAIDALEFQTTNLYPPAVDPDQAQLENSQMRNSVMEEAISGVSNSTASELISGQLEDSIKREIEEDIQKLKQIGPHGEGLEKFGAYRHPNDMCEKIGNKWSKVGAPAVPLLVESLKSGDCYFGWLLYAVNICLEKVGKAAIPILKEAMAEAFDTGNNTFKINLLEFMRKFLDNQDLSSVLGRALKDDDPKVRLKALQQLTSPSEKFEQPAVISLLKEAVLQDRDGSNRGVALFVLGRINSFKKDTSSADFLIQALDDRESSVREQAVSILGYMKASSAVPALIKRLNDRSDMVRYVTIIALGDIRDPRATQALIKKLKSRDFLLEACFALGDAGDPSAIPALERVASKVKVTPLTRVVYKIDHWLFPMGNPNPDYDAQHLKDAAMGAVYSIKRRYNIE